MAWSAAHGRANTTDQAWSTALGRWTVPPFVGLTAADAQPGLPGTVRVVLGRPCSGQLPVGAVGGAVFVFVRQDQVPSVAAVFAAVGDDVAGEPDAVFGGVRQQVAPSAAIDTDDGGFRLQHARSLAELEAVTACG